MHIELARTFLEVVRTGSLIAAAEQLHVTQTTVTARIQNLESRLGCALFVRNRSGAKLTENGERFAAYAAQLVQTWEAARRELALPEQIDNVLRVGGEISLWNPLLLSWITQFRNKHPNIGVRAEVGERSSLYTKLEHGVLDAVLMHQPDYLPELQIELLLEEKLILVRGAKSDAPYIYVDWSESFRQFHDAALPEYSRSAVTLDLGPMALQYLVHNGGSAYLRLRLAQPYLDRGLLERVPSAPEFSYPVYLVYLRTRQSPLFDKAFDVLRDASTKLDEWLPV